MLSSFPTDAHLQSEKAWCNLQNSAFRFKATLNFNHPFDFQTAIKDTSVLFVGEGNLSFSKALIEQTSHISK